MEFSESLKHGAKNVGLRMFGFIVSLGSFALGQFLGWWVLVIIGTVVVMVYLLERAKSGEPGEPTGAIRSPPPRNPLPAAIQLPETHVWERPTKPAVPPSKAAPPVPAPLPPDPVPPVDTRPKSIPAIPKPYNWQDEVMAKFPAIGVKDSRENRAFVMAYKKALDSEEEFDPEALAEQVMRDLAHSRTFKN